ncbi:MAG: sprT domain-containing protein [Cytophagaceae bacterium]|nr:sprT domain-containing protein [Cytophagaceae bacterium]
MKTPSLPRFEEHVPTAAVAYCHTLWQHHAFAFLVTRPRRTRLGTHCFHPLSGHRVTINTNLNPFAFLITYLHEVAHVLTVRDAQRNFPGRRRVLPHGRQWKAHFQTLLLPALTERIFPLSILEPLRGYAQNPAAATASCLPLAKALQALDQIPDHLMEVRHLAEGERFEFGKRIFIRGRLRRTRLLCVELPTGRRYTVPVHALVKRI